MDGNSDLFYEYACRILEKSWNEKGILKVLEFFLPYARLSLEKIDRLLQFTFPIILCESNMSNSDEILKRVLMMYSKRILDVKILKFSL
jgi:hypothetical protein